MAKKAITTRLDPDTKKEVESYADDLELGQTEATRRLIRAGLAAEGYDVATADGADSQEGPLERIGSPRTVAAGLLLAGAAGLLFLAAPQIATASATASLVALTLSRALTLAGTATVWVAALAQMALGLPLRNLVLPDTDTDTA